ncbi:sulfite exporter TauE/SafE family protein [Thermostilla marina]
MPIDISLIVFGGLAALLMGFAKTGLPGASILAVALMAQGFRHNAELSVGAMLPVLLVGDVFAVRFYGKFTSWKRLVRLFPTVVLGMSLGIGVLHIVEGNQLRPILGALLLFLFALEMARRYYGWNDVPHHWAFTVSIGLLAGFGTAVGNAAGPVMTMYLLSHELRKDKFLGTCAWFFFIVNLLKIVPFSLEGMITRETLLFDLWAIPMLLVGVAGGRYVARRISQGLFDFLVLVLAGAAALWMILG